MRRKLRQKRFFDELEDIIEHNTSPDAVVSRASSSFRVKDCSKSMSKFAKSYFPEIFTSDFCELHEEFFASVEDIVLNKVRKKNFYVRAAPRGHGKSQILSFLLPLWCMCYKYKRNILLLSDTADQAKGFISAIKTELEENEMLRNDFGELVSEEKWSQDKIITKNRVQMYGRGAGQKLRGSKFGSIRPDLVIIDDLENDEAVETEQQRKKLKNWFMKTVIPIGSPTTDFVYIGTVLHYESLLEKLLTEASFSMWNRKRYRAVRKFSNSPLWDTWEQMMTNPDDPDPETTAYNYYQRHRKKMLNGVEALWQEQGQDYYYDMMVLRLADPSSFASEYQNEPIDPTTAVFLPEWFDYYYELPVITKVFGAVDPALGKNASGDRAVVTWAGMDDKGFLYILETSMGRYKPDYLIDLIIAGAMKYQSNLESVTIETVQFQAMFKDEVAKRGLNAGIQIPINEFNDKTPKEIRLRGLVPRIKNKYIKFRKDQISLVNEFLRFPKGSDDGMDTVNMICSAAFPSTSNKLVFGGLAIAQKNRASMPLMMGGTLWR